MENSVKSPLKVGIIGAGPAGLTAAYQLTKYGCTVHVFEASSQVGGLSRTIELWGQKVDLGPHRFFSNDPKVNALWMEVVKDDFRLVNRLTRIYYQGKFFPYPLKPLETLVKLGFFKGILCSLSYLKQLFLPVKNTHSFESWVIRRFGNRLYDIFFKTYSEKLWGIGGNELDEDFAAQRIKKFNFKEILLGLIPNKRKTKHQTLAEVFAYPIEGTGMVYQRMADFVCKQGGQVFLNNPIEKLSIGGNGTWGVTLRNNEVVYFDKVISTMPLTLLLLRLPHVPRKIAEAVKKLSFRNTLLVYLKVQHAQLFPDNWIYVHDGRFKMGRITNFSNWVPEIVGGKDYSVLCLEYWANDEEDIWKMEEKDLIALGKEEIIKTGLVSKEDINEGFVYRIPRCYPVYKKGYKKYLNEIENYLSGVQHLSVIGRYGSFKYNNQDHSILMGLLAAENIALGKNHDLWRVNTDYDVYQEEGKVSEVGLLKA